MADAPKTVYIGAGGARMPVLVSTASEAVMATVGDMTVKFRDVVETTARRYPAYSQEKVRRTIWHMLHHGDLEGVR